MSRAPDVSRRRPEPSAFIRKIPEPSRANTIRFPSGEKSGSIADFEPVVIWLSPVPFDTHAQQLQRPWPTVRMGGEDDPALRCGGSGIGLTDGRRDGCDGREHQDGNGKGQSAARGHRPKQYHTGFRGRETREGHRVSR